MNVELKINRPERRLYVKLRMVLLDVLREPLGLAGGEKGCAPFYVATAVSEGKSGDLAGRLAWAGISVADTLGILGKNSA